MEAYQAPLDQETATLGLSIPIYQWGRHKSQVNAARAAKEQVLTQIELNRRNLEQDIVNGVTQFEQLSSQVRVAAKADTIAQRRFDVAKNRYLIGKVDVTNLQIAQNEKDQARQSYISTLRDYWLAYYGLRRATLFDFRNGAPVEKGVIPDL